MTFLLLGVFRYLKKLVYAFVRTINSCCGGVVPAGDKISAFSLRKAQICPRCGIFVSCFGERSVIKRTLLDPRVLFFCVQVSATKYGTKIRKFLQNLFALDLR